MNGFIHYKLIRVQLLLMPLMLLYGCVNSPTVIPMAMPGIASISALGKPAVVEPRTLNFIFEYKQIELTREQRNQLLSLYDWQHGAIISYGKVKSANDYMGLSIGHKRVQAVIQALAKHQEVIKISYDPTLVVDSMLIEEKIVKATHVTTNKPVGLIESTRL